MRPLEVVVAEIAAQARSQFKAVGIIPEVNVLVFHGSPQSLDENVAMGSAPTVHADPRSGLFKGGDECIDRILRSLVGIEYLRRTGFYRLIQAVQTELTVQCVGYLPGDNVAAEPVHNHHEVHESLPHPNVCNVCASDLVRATYGQVSEQITVNPMFRARC